VSVSLVKKQIDRIAPMAAEIPDPVKEATKLICGQAEPALEKRLKHDIVNSISRIKPDVVKDIDFEKDVMQGDFFASLSAPLQGIAIARIEGALAFYNRIGWNAAFLSLPLQTCVPAEGLETLTSRYHAKTLHDLAYVHPKHFEKILSKPGAASLWESLKRTAAAPDV